MQTTGFDCRHGKVGNRGPAPSIATVAFSSLGDGLIYLMMAESLRINGFRVTYFRDIGYQPRDWMPQLEIRKYPSIKDLEEQLSEFDLAIVSLPQNLRDRMDAAATDRLRRKYILVCQDTPNSWRFDLTDTYRSKCSSEVFSVLHDLLDSGGSIRYRRFADESVVDITLDYMRMHLPQVTRLVPLTPPRRLAFRRLRQRVVASPDSAWPEKRIGRHALSWPCAACPKRRAMIRNRRCTCKAQTMANHAWKHL